METGGGLESVESPRSTVISSSIHRMTTSGGQTEDGAASDLKPTQPSPGDGEGSSGAKNAAGSAGAPADNSKASPEAKEGGNKDDKAMEGGLSPTPHSQYLQGYPAHLTPQPGQGYYNVGYQQSQVTPEPPSPAGPGPTVYDMGSFFQQPAAFAPHNSPFVPQTPLSPRRTAAMAAGIPPASPLFPRVNSGAGGLPGTAGTGIEHRLMDGHRGIGAPPSPSVPYLSPPLGPNSMYQSYHANGIGSHADSPEDITGWGDRYVVTQLNLFHVVSCVHSCA